MTGRLSCKACSGSSPSSLLPADDASLNCGRIVSSAGLALELTANFDVQA